LHDVLTKFIEIDGAFTRCLTAGEPGKPGIMMIHGLSLTSEIWLRSIEPLARDFHVVAVDMLGHGFTRPAPGRDAVTIPDKVDHLLAVADALGWDRFIIMGSSYGALIGANMFLKRPDRIEKLVIAGSGSCFNTEAQMKDFVERIYAAYKPTLTTTTMPAWRKRLESTFFDPATIPAELPPILSLCYAQPWTEACWESTIATMRDQDAFRPFRILERLEQVSLPTLVVWGLDDKGGIYESAVAAVKRMPDCRLIAFDRCGHMPMLEHPERYIRVVREFLGVSAPAEPALAK